MSENLMQSIAPQLAAPVSREPLASGAEAVDGVDQSVITIGPVTISFADDGAE